MRFASVLSALILTAIPAFSQTPCDGNPTVVRVSTIKPGAMEKFMAAVAAHKTWYRDNGVTENEIFTARVLVRDEATKSWKNSETEVISFHVRPPSSARTPKRGDAAWNAYVQMYRDSSEIKAEYMTCMPKMGR